MPPGWVESDASHLDYGSALLSKTTGQPTMPGQPPPVANDTRIVLGRLDQKLYASAEATNPKAALRLGSDMGEFFMPYPGTRINQEIHPAQRPGLAGSASYYEVKFSDTTKPNGQIWTGVIGAATQPSRAPAALVRGVAGNFEQPGGQERRQGAGRVDPALDTGGPAGPRTGPGSPRAGPGRTGSGPRPGCTGSGPRPGRSGSGPRAGCSGSRHLRRARPPPGKSPQRPHPTPQQTLPA